MNYNWTGKITDRALDLKGFRVKRNGAARRMEIDGPDEVGSYVSATGTQETTRWAEVGGTKEARMQNRYHFTRG